MPTSAGKYRAPESYIDTNVKGALNLCRAAHAVIPTIVSQLASGAAEVRLGELDATRDFTFVEDTCRGLAAIAGMDAGLGEVFHIGSNRKISIRDLFGLIAEIMRRDAVIARDPGPRAPASEVLRLRCDNTKLRKACGFEPEVSLRDGLRPARRSGSPRTATSGGMKSIFGPASTPC